MATRGARFGDSLCGQFTGFLSLRREWATGLWGRPELPLAPAEIHPKGIIVFTSDGRFIYLYSRGDLPKFASNNRATGTADENKAVVQGSIATFGTYSVAGKELSLKIEQSTFPNWIGADQKRTIAITGDELKWHNPAGSGGYRFPLAAAPRP